jgi:protein-disulfide isomerase
MPSTVALRLALVCALVCACSSGDAKASAGAATTSAASTTSAADTTKPSAADSLLLLAADRGRIAGDTTAKQWVVIVSDFECPYCKSWHDSTYDAFRREYVDNGKVRAAYVNFPLQQHRHALPAAEAAMCASAQGKFWQMHDRLFNTQEKWNGLPDARAFFDSLAVASGVDTAAFRACVSGHKLVPLIRADYQRAVNSGVNATPTFIIVGGGMMSGAQPIQAMRQAIDAAIAKGGAGSKH